MDTALKKIPVAQLRRGMYLHKMTGSWLDHPFWRSAFVVDDTTDLAAVQRSGIEEVWIDVSKGLDVLMADAASLPAAPVAPTAAAPAPAMPEPEAPAAPVAPAVIARPQPIPLAEELQQARAICQGARDAVASMFGEVRMGRAVDATAALPLVQEISDSVQRNPGALISIARLKSRDDYTYMHSVAVCGLMVALAKQIGQSDAQVREAGLGGLLHDLGKALVPPEVLNKPGSLTEAEFRIMKSHPMEGWKLVNHGAAVSRPVQEVILHHHEKFDGSGYPHRLSGEGISPLARMGAICDVYDAVTSKRCYKDAWDPAHAVRQMMQWKGHFDPALMQAFVKSLGIYPVGSLVRLASDRLAVIVEQNPQALLQPVVRVFHCAKNHQPLVPERIDLRTAAVPDKIVGIEDTKKWGFQNLDALWMQA
ncbi:HD-GYP domain-containing protein [uncultured Xylophilus sp.]|uniref:HD-GYP domain-containing protein n=1 Tax=uncultured Xylophilus sp. TaxID=296832 RepID=UPI0025DD7086|nr:HD-GYP domain-containing protein [uncultured Xylophilus sp.]